LSFGCGLEKLKMDEEERERRRERRGTGDEMNKVHKATCHKEGTPKRASATQGPGETQRRHFVGKEHNVTQ